MKPVKTVLIVGAGPSGLYCAKHLEKKLGNLVHIDLVESRPVLGGLLRYGVAPDHFLIKRSLFSLQEQLLGPSSNVQILSNVNLSRAHLQELQPVYDWIFYASGCNAVRPIPIPGDDSPEVPVLQAFDFVRFYNGDYLWHQPSPYQIMNGQSSWSSMCDLPKKTQTKTVVIIGNGNVSIDIARILTRNWDQYQQKYPNEYAQFVDERFLSWLRGNETERVVIVGRRGALQSSFALKEFRELVEVSEASGWTVRVDPHELGLSLNPESLQETDIKADILNRKVLGSAEIIPDKTDFGLSNEAGSATRRFSPNESQSHRIQIPLVSQKHPEKRKPKCAEPYEE